MPSLRALALFVAAAVGAAAVPSSAHAGRVFHLRVPKFQVDPHTDREVCTFVPIPMDEAFNFQKSVVVNVGGGKTFTTHHFLAWVYNGTDIEKFPPKGQLVDSKACLDFGPADTNTRTLIAGAQAARLVTSLGDGLAQQLEPTVSAGGKKELGIILNSHWINNDPKKKHTASVKLTLVAARPHTIRRFVKPIFEVTANGYIAVAPGAQGSEHGFWGPGSLDFGHGSLGGGSVPDKNATACVVGVTSHMHKRGREFAIDLVQGPVDLLPIGPSPRMGTVIQAGLLDTKQYTDPPQIPLHGMAIHPGQYLRYTCTHANQPNPTDATIRTKMGCEEQPGVVPGKSIIQLVFSGQFNFSDVTTGAAKRCSTDADCTGFGTGHCVQANLVFGFTSDDDMCIMPGGYYDATVDGNCDLSQFPIVN